MQMEGPPMRCKYLHTFLVSCSVVASCSHSFWYCGFRCCACGGGFDSTRDSNQAAALAQHDASDGLVADTVADSKPLEHPYISSAPPSPPSALPSIGSAPFSQLLRSSPTFTPSANSFISVLVADQTPSPSVKAGDDSGSAVVANQTNTSEAGKNPASKQVSFDAQKADYDLGGDPASATVGWGYQFPRVAATAMIALAIGV